MNADAAVAHGYTWRDLHHLTRLTFRLDRWHVPPDDERYDAVLFAVAERLLSATSQPTRGHLLDVARNASDAHVRDEMRAHGRSTRHVGESRPRYCAYWNAPHAQSPEAAVVDQFAAAQIWPLLQPRQRQALTALAETGDYAQAATALGVPQASFNVLISTARRRFYTWWHEHEAPSRQWRADRRVSDRAGRDPSGRQRLTTDQVDALRARYHANESLGVLAAECGFSKATLSRLFNGKSQPAKETAA